VGPTEPPRRSGGEANEKGLLQVNSNHYHERSEAKLDRQGENRSGGSMRDDKIKTKAMDADHTLLIFIERSCISPTTQREMRDEATQESAVIQHSLPLQHLFLFQSTDVQRIVLQNKSDVTLCKVICTRQGINEHSVETHLEASLPLHPNKTFLHYRTTTHLPAKQEDRRRNGISLSQCAMMILCQK